MWGNDYSIHLGKGRPEQASLMPDQIMVFNMAQSLGDMDRPSLQYLNPFMDRAQSAYNGNELTVIFFQLLTN